MRAVRLRSAATTSSSCAGCGARCKATRHVDRHRAARSPRKCSKAVGNTLMLAAVATLIGFFFGCLFGFVAGYFRDTVDRQARFAALGASACRCRTTGSAWCWSSSSPRCSAGCRPTGAGPGGSADWIWNWEHMRHLILPAITMSVIPMGIIARTVRALVAEILVAGVRRRAARQGTHRLRRLPARGEERCADRAGGDGHPARLSAGRLDPDRDGVLLAGHRVAVERRHLPARPAAAAGDDPGARDVLRACSTWWWTSCRPCSTRASQRRLSARC